MEFIRYPSDKLQDLNLLLIGGKALSLSQLYQSNFLIPNIFMITTKAFDYFLGSQMKEYKNILTHMNNNVNHPRYDLHSIQQKIMSKTLPINLLRAIHNSFLLLNTEFVAVRSSATSEDRNKYSSAGQFDSFLGVTKENLPLKIKSCWVSLFNPWAIAYLRREEDFGKMAVIIQKMINADASGVCFSINPVTNNLNSLTIEAILGLGEPLVQGTIIPDHYIVDKKTLNILDKRISQQKEKLKLDTVNGGTKKCYIESKKTQKQKVSDNTIKDIANLALKVEKFYNKPVDIEWAFKDNKLYLLQGRPITTI